MLPSQPTTREESPLPLCSISSPERPFNSEEKSQEELIGKSWLISSCTESYDKKKAEDDEEAEEEAAAEEDVGDVTETLNKFKDGGPEGEDEEEEAEE